MGVDAGVGTGTAGAGGAGLLVAAEFLLLAALCLTVIKFLTMGLIIFRAANLCFTLDLCSPGAGILKFWPT